MFKSMLEEEEKGGDDYYLIELKKTLYSTK